MTTERLFKYQYDFHRQRVDYFAPLPPAGEQEQPNCFLLVSEVPFTKREAQQLFDRINNKDADLPSYVKQLGATW